MKKLKIFLLACACVVAVSAPVSAAGDTTNGGGVCHFEECFKR
ncbi:hypothetical protein [Pseudalkalibacillus sp. SCS-8]